MIHRTLLFAMLLVASSAQASWWPVLSNDYITLETGQQTTVTVRAQWSGLVDYGWSPWHFRSTNETVAFVEGSLEQLGTTGTVTIIAKKPGTAKIYTTSGGGPYATIVVTEDKTPMSIAATPATAGRPVTLTAFNPPPMSTSWWYFGHLSDFSKPIGLGNEVTFTPNAAGVIHVWVYAVAPNGVTMMELAVEVKPAARSRAVRH